MSAGKGAFRQGEDEGGETAERRDGVLVVREGLGANCSSLGSLVTTLVLGTAAAGTLMSAVLAALERETLEKIHRPPAESEVEDDDASPSERAP